MGLLWSLGKAIVNKARDHDADPDCTMCLGSGTYVDGMTVKTCRCVWEIAYAKRDAAQGAQPAGSTRRARAEPFVPFAVRLYAEPESRETGYQPTIAEQMRAANAAADARAADPVARAARERQREEAVESGQATLCCKRTMCNCGQNLRLVDGVETALPGVMRLGWEDNEALRGLEEARLRHEAGESKTYSLRERAQQQREASQDAARADRSVTPRPEPDESGMEFPSMGEPPPQR